MARSIAATLTSAALLMAAAPSAPSAQPTGGGSGPSFDCARATSLDEQTVCASPSLARMDRRVADLYARALAADPSGEVRAEGRRALASRRGCVTRGCVALWYDARLAALSPGDGAADKGTAGPLRVGRCTTVRITGLGARLEGAPDSGSTVDYDNGTAQVSYEVIPGVRRSRVGDAVSLCLVKLPTNCPPGDDRGKIYSALNLRTHDHWRASDDQHGCGGA